MSQRRISSGSRANSNILLKIGGLNLDEVRGNFIDPRVADFLSGYGRKFSAAGLEHLTRTPFPDSQLHLFLY